MLSFVRSKDVCIYQCFRGEIICTRRASRWNFSDNSKYRLLLSNKSVQHLHKVVQGDNWIRFLITQLWKYPYINLVLPQTKKAVVHNSLIISILKLYNHLSISIRTIPYKNYIRGLLLKRTFYSVNDFFQFNDFFNMWPWA